MIITNNSGIQYIMYNVLKGRIVTGKHKQKLKEALTRRKENANN